MTDLAVSQLLLAERNAAAARTRMEQHLDKLAPWNPQRIAAVRSELAQYEDFAERAVDQYTNDRRVIGNSLLAQARQHSIAADQLLASIVSDLTGQAIAARERVVAGAAIATRISQIVVTAAVLIGALLTYLVLRSIILPLRRLTVAMDGLNAGNVDGGNSRARPRRDRRDGPDLGDLPRYAQGVARNLAQFEALRSVGRAVGSTLDLETVLSMVVARAVEFSHAQAGMIFEYDDAARIFRFRTSHGTEDELIEQPQGRTDTPRRRPNQRRGGDRLARPDADCSVNGGSLRHCGTLLPGWATAR